MIAGVSIGFIVGCLVAALVALFMVRRTGAANFARGTESAAADLSVLRERIAGNESRIAQYQEQDDRSQSQLDAQREQISQIDKEKAALETRLELEVRAADEKLRLLAQAEERLKGEFQNLANRIFDEKSVKLTEQNREHLGQLLTPFRDQLADFRNRVDSVHAEELRDRTALKTQIVALQEANLQISTDARNLASALKGDSKMQGNWGEMILERVLEASGLQKGREYETQMQISDADGRRYLPDVVVHLPDGKDVIVDAKVSLTAYERYCNNSDDTARPAALKAHLLSVRAHIDELSAKKYDTLVGIRSLDFVLMFIPVEAALVTAIREDVSLFETSFAKRILLVSPSTLLATLRTIENMWRSERQNRNALQIADKAASLYDKFVDFVGALDDVGEKLDRARGSWEEAKKRLVSGRGNLVNRTQELLKLGVKSRKQLEKDLVEGAAEELLVLESESMDETGETIA